MGFIILGSQVLLLFPDFLMYISLGDFTTAHIWEYTGFIDTHKHRISIYRIVIIKYQF